MATTATPMLALLVLGPPEAELSAPSERVEVAPISPLPSEPPSPASSQATDPDQARDPVQAAEPAPARPGEGRTWQAELFVDVAYGFNSNVPDNHVYRGMYTNPRTNELSVSSVGAFIKHPLTAREPWQFELGFHAGAAVDALTSGEPIPGGPDGKYAGAEVFKHIALANAGFEIRKTKTFLGAGVFESPMGIGSFWTKYNWNYTTTWESNIVPYYLAGVKVAQQLPGNVELAGWFVNGFQSYADRNSVPSGLVTVTWNRPAVEVGPPRSGTNSLTLSTQLYFGPEGVDLRPADWMVYWDTWVVWNFDDHFSMAAVWDLGVDRVGQVGARPLDPAGEQQLYTGGALFARGTVLEREHLRMDLALRPEASWDRDGRFFGVEQWLVSGTATASLWIWEHLLLRMEYRYDYSSAARGFFYRREFGSDDAVGLAREQHTVFLSLTAWWDFWFGRREQA
ncbi:MAG: outer membrane beta-barrel protein [Enhygromyxa sp.]